MGGFVRVDATQRLCRLCPDERGRVAAAADAHRKPVHDRSRNTPTGPQWPTSALRDRPDLGRRKRPPALLAEACEAAASWLAAPTLTLLGETSDYWKQAERVASSVLLVAKGGGLEDVSKRTGVKVEPLAAGALAFERPGLAAR